MNRRQFLTTLSLAAGANAFSPLAVFASPAKRQSSLRFLLTERQFPLLFVGESIRTSEEIHGIHFFKPWFGAGREVINPAEPKVTSNGRRLQFTEPGEYYLYVNGAPLKTVIFPREERVSDAVLRLFDFALANNIYFAAHDNVWYPGRRKYLQSFFFDDMPMVLSCGPTHQMFRMLVAERLGLPTRITSANGAFYSGGVLSRIPHNIPEVYIPRAEKFVACDLNAGYVPQWIDALDLAAATRKWGPEAHTTEMIEDLGVPIYESVDTSPVSGYALKLLEMLTAFGGNGGEIEPSRKLLAPSRMNSRSRANAARAFYSGTGYWGGAAEWAQPTGTAFLRGQFQFVLLEDDEKLRSMILEELQAVKAEVVDPDEMRDRLRCGTEEAIERQDWLIRFTADDERSAPLPPLNVELI